MPPQAVSGPLNEKEQVEFDNIRLDEINACHDLKKLMRLEKYMRDQGFLPTADAVEARLRELGTRAANAEQVERDPQEARRQAEEKAKARADILAWTKKQKELDAALSANGAQGTSHTTGHPPVRAPAANGSAAPKHTAAQQPAAGSKPKGDSAVGTQVRSGREYYDRWEKKVEAALAEADADSGGPAASASATAASTAGLARSPELTQRLLELNRDLSPVERLVLSGQEKAKGNEHFRAKEYAEAVEHYTLALGLRGSGGDPSLFGNRAAAYLKLHLWEAAELDTTAALEADPGMVKAWLRRAGARLELGKVREALADCDSALALQGDLREAAALREAVLKKLEASGAGMKKMAIEEVEDEEDGVVAAVGHGHGQKKLEQQHHREQKQLEPQQQRRKLVVVEESDTDEEEEAPPKAAAGHAAAAQQVAPTSAPGPVAAAHVAPAAASMPCAGSELHAAVAREPSGPGASAPAVAGQPGAAAAPLELPPPPAEPAPATVGQFDAAVLDIRQQGNTEFRAGNYVRAAQLYSEALKLAPDSSQLYLNRSMARLKSELAPEALRDAAFAVALDPASYKAVHKRSRAKQQLRLWQAAREDLQQCLDLMPPADAATGAAKRDREDVEREVADMDRQLQAAVERAAARAAAAAARPQRVTNYARARVTIEEHADEAEEEEHKPLVSEEEAARTETIAAQRVAGLRSKAAEARAAWLAERDRAAREAHQQELLSWQAACERAQAAAAEAQVASAAAAAASVQWAAAAAAEGDASGTDGDDDGRSVDELKEQGNVHLREKRYAEAEECYRRALRRDPHNPFVTLNMALLLIDMRRWAEAETFADQVLKLADNVPHPEQATGLRFKAAHRRALARRGQGRLHEARDDLLWAKRMAGQSAAIDAELESLGYEMADARRAQQQQQQAAEQANREGPTGQQPTVPTAAAPAAVSAQVTPAPATAAPAGAAPTALKPAPGPAPAPAAAGCAVPPPARHRIQIEEASDSDSEDEPPRPAVQRPSSAGPVPAAASTSSPASHPNPAAPSSTGPSQPAQLATAVGAPSARPADAVAMQQPQSAGDPEEAERLRAEGNRLVGVGNYVRALDFYSRSIQACAHNPQAYCNRAAMHLQLKRPGEALLDAELAIAQYGDQPYYKAMYRKAAALRELGRYGEAARVFRDLLELSPDDEELLEEVQQVQRLAMGPGGASQGAAGSNGGASSANGQSGSAGERAAGQQGPARHKVLVVEEVEDEEGSSGEEEERQQQASAPVAGSSSSSPAPSAAPVADMAATIKATAAVSSSGKPAGTATPSAAPAAKAAPSQPTSTTAPAPKATAAAAASSGASASRIHEAASAKAAAALAAKAPKMPKPPKNAHEFEHAIKTLASHPAVLHEFVRTVDPAQYAAIIKANLSTRMVQAIVDAAKEVVPVPEGSGEVQGGASPEGVEFAVRALESLTLVQRFEMTYGLSSKAVKEDVKALVGTLAAAGRDVALLKKSYKL